MRSREYLGKIRGSAGLSRAVLKKIEVSGDVVTFFLVTDRTYSAEDVAYAERVSGEFVPDGYRAAVSLLKSVPDKEGVRREIAGILRERFPAVAAFLTPEEIEVAVDGGGGRFVIRAGKEECEKFERGVADALSEELGRRFCGVWRGETVEIERDEGDFEREALPPAEPVRAPRLFEVRDFSPIDGGTLSPAVYIADLTKEGQASVCGEISHIEERMTKKEKPYFRIVLTDGSGQLRASYFSKKATVEKVRALKAGDLVYLTGVNEFFGGEMRYTARTVDFGAPPKGFIPEARPPRPVPALYSKIFPEPFFDNIQGKLFGERELPADFRAGKFVVFDLETTGLNTTPGSSMDRIIEIGAVKIVNGSVCEKFSSFVACPNKIPPKITEITGIDDGMLVGAPDISDAIADFRKFSDGAFLVGHNVQFDLSFVRYYGECEGYHFEERSFDTLALAQKLLTLKNYQLNTVADHFGFAFRHHRAFDDAFVTAKIFIELIRMKGGL